MNIGQLKELLDRYEDHMSVMILEWGSYTPREINLGPLPREIEQVDEDYTADCEWRIGETVIIIGYGNY